MKTEPTDTHSDVGTTYIGDDLAGFPSKGLSVFIFPEFDEIPVCVSIIPAGYGGQASTFTRDEAIEMCKDIIKRLGGEA